MQLRRGCVAVVLGALVVGGCGGQTKTASHATTTKAASPTTASTPATTGATSTDCNALGINPTGMHEGTCTHAGFTYVIVDENHSLKLRTLSAKLTGVHSTAVLEGQTAQGRFVVASLDITNRLELAQQFDAQGTQQAALILEGTRYTEDASAEKSADRASCLSRSVRIPAGKSETCDVLFAVPTSAAAQIGKHGSGDLYIVDFGSDLAASVSPQTVGQIRLYR
jgi:hypothetical protein